MDEKTRVTVTKLPHYNTLVIKQYGDKQFFITSYDSIVISVDSLSFLLKFLVENNYLSHKVLEGILEEFHSSERTAYEEKYLSGEDNSFIS